MSGEVVSVAWLPNGWPRQVRQVLGQATRPDIVAAPELSIGARAALTEAGVGWFDETGAAYVVLSSTFVIDRGGARPTSPKRTPGWRAGTLAVCEALLIGTKATVDALHERTGLAMSTVGEALNTLAQAGLLESNAHRGRNAGRNVSDNEKLLHAYARAAETLRPPNAMRVGVLWKDPTVGLIKLGRAWHAAGVGWSATSALSANIMAPMLTEVSPMEVYVDATTVAELGQTARIANVRESKGGRLLLRPFPTPAKAALSDELLPGFWSAPWPRVFADLRPSGVRGEEAAEFLAEEYAHVRS